MLVKINHVQKKKKPNVGQGYQVAKPGKLCLWSFTVYVWFFRKQISHILDVDTGYFFYFYLLFFFVGVQILAVVLKLSKIKIIK